VAVVAPASAPPNPQAIDQGIAVLERLGFKPKPGRNVRKRLGFLAGTDRERAADLMNAFLDPRVRAIFCVRGGYGSSRLLPFLDYQAIRKNPKILIGYSDITSLHCALLKECNLVSFHGPMLNSDLIRPDFPDFSLSSLMRVVTQPGPFGSVRGGGRDRKEISVLRPGKAAGRLLGGNLTLLCSLLATPWQPDFRGAILFFEDLDEAPYRFDRMLTQLLNAGLLQQVAGIAIGINKNCLDPKAKKSREYRQTLEDVFRDRLLPLRVPVVSGIPFGHVARVCTLPLGVRALLDANGGDLELIEKAVA
jgi:muramoyltetrapeptide carboxypeptidase